MDQEKSGYIGLALKKLKDAESQVGDEIRVTTDHKQHVGVLIPRAQIGSDQEHIVIKLDSGYNIGVRLNDESKIEKLRDGPKSKPPEAEIEREIDESLPTVSILSTGGTIASRVDYKTGAVHPALNARDLYDAVPELTDHANIRAKVVMSALSENIDPDDWSLIAEAVAEEIRHGIDGVIIAHGTDTLGFTAAALAFALQNIPVPIVLVGSQRSSDRPSSDASMNLLQSVKFVGEADAAEVMVVMHGESDDTFTYAHRGVRTRKCHTSRRDAFQSINNNPLFKIERNHITEIQSPIMRRNRDRDINLKSDFDKLVALVKSYPGIDSTVIDNLIDCGYRGLVIEGTGLGHAPEHLHESLRKAIESDVIVTMTSQCIWGRTNLNVYRPGVEMLQMGIIPCEDMLPETALVKLMWLLGNFDDSAKIQKMMVQNLVGEIGERTEIDQYGSMKEV
ncbi:MAG: Glu-tRNA(Gln) amidotransferase subunit GatD [Candidatus Thorarchaeota archaeon]